MGCFSGAGLALTLVQVKGIIKASPFKEIFNNVRNAPLEQCPKNPHKHIPKPCGLLVVM